MTWQRFAACRGADPDLFFPPLRGGRNVVAEAKQICADCPVRKACLEHALTEREIHGVWGGTSEIERRAIRRQRQRLRAVS